MAECPMLADPRRSLLGAAQEGWLADTWSTERRWNLLAQQTLMGRFSWRDPALRVEDAVPARGELGLGEDAGLPVAGGAQLGGQGPVEEGALSHATAALETLPPVTAAQAPEPSAAASASEKAAAASAAPQTATAPSPARTVSGRDARKAKAEAGPEPFFGRPPDDPGVREGAQPVTEQKSRLKLF